MTLLVPVQFPMPCVDSAAFEECILHNLEQLDAQAMTFIQERDYLEAIREDCTEQSKGLDGSQVVYTTL